MMRISAKFAYEMEAVMTELNFFDPGQEFFVVERRLPHRAHASPLVPRDPLSGRANFAVRPEIHILMKPASQGDPVSALRRMAFNPP